MGQVRRPEPVKLIIGMISGETGLFALLQERLSQKFGQIDFKSDLMPFNHTHYYEPEMGKDLKRKFVSFQLLVDPENIADVKIFTNNLEREFLYPNSNRRRINLDPGYIEPSKLILASTKNYQHRIYLGKGIYGEVTLRWTKGSFQHRPWTYPDYKSKDYIEVFNQIRKIYLG
ncbi:DUF4416 family protein [bacterium]|nr:DUF4416 family protein [bacterium]